MKKEYSNAIIVAISIAVTIVIFQFPIRGQISWPYVIGCAVVFPFAYLIGLRLHKRKKAKKEEGQRRE